MSSDVARDWFAAMRRGDWEAAWRATDRIELRRRVAQCEPGFVPRPEHLRWDGTPFAGRRVRVRCLHGLGDTLQFLRFVPLLSRAASELHLLVPPPLLPLLQGASDLGHVSNGWTDDPPAADVEIEVMELPYALRLTLEELPPPYPLHALPALRPAWPLRRAGELQVGLCWAASDWDPSRSLSLQDLAPLFALGGVRFHSLQQGPAADDPLLAASAVNPLHAHTAAIVDAARAIRALDLLICVDGMPAHLAGSLACPTWVLLKREADWRWMEGREASPWYPGMRLWRQECEGGWSAVVARVSRRLEWSAAELQHRPATPSTDDAGVALRSTPAYEATRATQPR